MGRERKRERIEAHGRREFSGPKEFTKEFIFTYLIEMVVECCIKKIKRGY